MPRGADRGEAVVTGQTRNYSLCLTGDAVQRGGFLHLMRFNLRPAPHRLGNCGFWLEIYDRSVWRDVWEASSGVGGAGDKGPLSLLSLNPLKIPKGDSYLS